jgi:hypothetical protein
MQLWQCCAPDSLDKSEDLLSQHLAGPYHKMRPQSKICHGGSALLGYSGANVKKNLRPEVTTFCNRAFVPGEPFQPSLMFVGKARSLP